MKKFTVARTLLLLGFVVGLMSWMFTIGHVGDPKYVLVPEFELGASHAWYHAFREAAGDLAAMFTILVIFFGPKNLRVPATWIICLALMLGYYSPFWIGMPFMPELSAPNMAAETIHIVMATLAVAGLLIGRSEFYAESET